MSKLMRSAAMACAAAILLASCVSKPAPAPEPEVKKETTAAAAQRARNAASGAFADMGVSVGDPTVPRSLPSSAKPADPALSDSVSSAAPSAQSSSQGQNAYSSQPEVPPPPVRTAQGDNVPPPPVRQAPPPPVRDNRQAPPPVRSEPPAKIDSGSAKVNRSAAEPSWIKNPQTGADQRQFLVAVGLGKNNIEAEASAASGLAKIIRQNIKSETYTSTSDYVDSSGASRSSSALDEIIETETMVDALVGVVIREFWEGKNGTIYALALLNRMETSRYYMSKINEGIRVVQDMTARADSFGVSFDGYAAMQKAASAAGEVSRFLDIVYAVDPGAHASTRIPYGSAREIEARAARLASEIPLDIVISGDVDNRIGSSVAKVFGQYGFKTTLGGSSAPYVFEASVAFQDIPSERNAFVRYVFDGALKQRADGRVMYPYSANGREGHLNPSEAAQRAMRTLEKSISGKFSDDFLTFVKEN